MTPCLVWPTLLVWVASFGQVLAADELRCWTLDKSQKSSNQLSKTYENDDCVVKVEFVDFNQRALGVGEPVSAAWSATIRKPEDAKANALSMAVPTDASVNASTVVSGFTTFLRTCDKSTIESCGPVSGTPSQQTGEQHGSFSRVGSSESFSVSSGITFNSPGSFLVGATVAIPHARDSNIVYYFTAFKLLSVQSTSSDSQVVQAAKDIDVTTCRSSKQNALLEPLASENTTTTDSNCGVQITIVNVPVVKPNEQIAMEWTITADSKDDAQRRGIALPDDGGMPQRINDMFFEIVSSTVKVCKLDLNAMRCNEVANPTKDYVAQLTPSLHKNFSTSDTSMRRTAEFQANNLALDHEGHYEAFVQVTFATDSHKRIDFVRRFKIVVTNEDPKSQLDAQIQARGVSLGSLNALCWKTLAFGDQIDVKYDNLIAPIASGQCPYDLTAKLVASGDKFKAIWSFQANGAVLTNESKPKMTQMNVYVCDGTSFDQCSLFAEKKRAAYELPSPSDFASVEKLSSFSGALNISAKDVTVNSVMFVHAVMPLSLQANQRVDMVAYAPFTKAVINKVDPSSNSSNTWMIIGICLGIAVVLGLGGFFFWRRRKNNQENSDGKGAFFLTDGNITLGQELEQATSSVGPNGSTAASEVASEIRMAHAGDQRQPPVSLNRTISQVSSSSDGSVVYIDDERVYGRHSTGRPSKDLAGHGLNASEDGGSHRTIELGTYYV